MDKLKNIIIVALACYFLFPGNIYGKQHEYNKPVKICWSTARKVLPLSVDNSVSEYFPPVIDQKGGSCAQASGIGYLFTYEMNRYLNRKADACGNNLFSYLFTWNFLNGGRDEGGFVDQGLNIAMKYGVMSDTDYGYGSAYQYKWADGYDKYYNAMHYRAKCLYDFSSMTEQDLHKIKAYLCDKGDGLKGGGVLTFSTMSSNWKIDNNYRGPSLTEYHAILTDLATEGAHALTIVGYDDTVVYTDNNGDKHEGAFIVVNSWGRAMHDRGRFYMPYYFFLNRGKSPNMSTLSFSMTGADVHTHKPLLVYKIDLDYSSRDDLSFVMGASDEVGATHPQDRHVPVIFFNQGGDYPMQGAYSQNGHIEFALDYTEYLPSSDYLHSKYFLNVIRSQRGSKNGEGCINRISLIDYRVLGAPREYICRDIDSKCFKWGENLFTISTRPLMTVSANHFRLFNNKGEIEQKKTHAVRSSKGKYAKMHVLGYDRSSDMLTIQYRYQKDGKKIFENE